MSFIQKAVVKGQIASSVQFRNIFYADVVPTGLDTYQSLWDLYLDGIYDHMMTVFGNFCSVSAFDVYEKSGGVWVYMDTVTFAKTGALAEAGMPGLLAAVIIGKIVGNRAFGRKFFPGLVKGATTGDVISGGTLTALIAAAADYIAFVTGPNGGQLQPGIVTKDGAFHAFSLSVIPALVGTMRRRKPGIGI